MNHCERLKDPTYVIFVRTEINSHPIILFFGECHDLADAEEIKAAKNREMPARLADMSVCVGVAEVVLHESDEDMDFIKITPRDGSEPFLWSDMVEGHEIARLSEGG